MRPVNRVHTLALAVLEAVCHYYVTDEVNVAIPARQIVTAGPPAWDCELVAVWSERTGPHDGDITRDAPEPILGAPASALRYVQFGITICRCSPQTLQLDNGVLEFPTVENEIAAAALVHHDEVLVPNALRAASGSLLPRSNDWAVLDWKVIGPQGGFVASEHKVRVATDWQPAGS